MLAGTGGVLTTLDGATGIGKGPAEQHDATWLDIASEIAGAISEELQQGIDAPELARAHPGEPQFAYFELRKPECAASAAQVLSDAKTAFAIGLRIDAQDLSERTGYKLTARPHSSSASAPVEHRRAASNLPAIQHAKPPL